MKQNIIIFISGNGTNLQHVIDNYHNSGKINIALVVSNKVEAYGLHRATKANIPTLCIPHSGKIRQQHEKEIIKGINHVCDIQQIDYILCLGYMRIITSHLLNYLTARKIPIYNLHPALPNDDKLIGPKCIERAYQQYLEGERDTSGVMIHKLIEDVDMGSCIVYKEIDMLSLEELEHYKKLISISEKICIAEFIDKLSR